MAPTLDQLEGVFTSLISALLALGGVVLFIMLLTGGFKFLTSGGDPKAVEGAKKTMTTAIAGIVLLAASYLILKILSDITGVIDITEFNITHN